MIVLCVNVSVIEWEVLLKDVRVNIIKIFLEIVLIFLINFGLLLKSCI